MTQSWKLQVPALSFQNFGVNTCPQFWDKNDFIPKFHSSAHHVATTYSETNAWLLTFQAELYITSKQYHLQSTRPIYFPLLLRTSPINQSHHHQSSNSSSLSLLLRLLFKSLLCNPFSDSDLFQLKCRPTTTSLRYVSKFPPLNYQQLLCIFPFS